MKSSSKNPLKVKENKYLVTLLSQSWEIQKIIILLHLMPDNFILQMEFVKSHNFIQILNFDKVFQVCFI